MIGLSLGSRIFPVLSEIAGTGFGRSKAFRGAGMRREFETTGFAPWVDFWDRRTGHFGALVQPVPVRGP
jgi:hypothetical protein